MHYKRVGHDRYIMIAMLLASVLRVGRATPAAAALPVQEFSPTAAPPSGLLGLAQTSAGEAAKTAEKLLWGAGKFLLDAGESVNYVMDVALGSVLDLLRAGGRAYDAVAARVGHLPVIGFGAAGVSEALKTALDAADSDVKHSALVRKAAYDKLRRKMAESGARLREPSAARPAIVFPQA